jgi:simple sugar transport system ATP-binding protein
VEIFKALWKGATLLILDEPTAVLTPQEISSLFDLLHGLRKQGHSILFISHKLEEIERLCDRVSLLRKGRTVGCFEVRQTDRRELSRLMLGRELETIHRKGPDKHTSPGSTGMALSSAALKSFTFACRGTEGSILHGDWSLEIPCGRITALVGVEGNGQGELVRSILGLTGVPGVELSIGGEPLPDGVHSRIAAGVGLIPEDRQRTGLVLDFTLAENLALKDIERAPWSRSGWLSPGRAREEAVQRIKRFDIQPPDPSQSAAALSGGNQQKVVAAREISRPHRLLVAVNPTRGLDAGACQTVHTALAADADSGAAILLITTEIEEALALADQFCVLFKGRVSVLPRSDWTQEKIGLAMMGVSEPTRFVPSDPSSVPASTPVAP